MSVQLSRQTPIVVIAFVIVGLLVYGFWPTPIEVDIVHATRGKLQVTVRDDGETRIKEKYIVTAPVEGRMQRLELHPGDIVSRDQTIVARIEPIDPTLLDARSKAQAEARVRATEATQQQSHSSLKQRNEALELARHDFDRARDLIKTNAISSSDFDRAEHRHAMAQADVRSAEFAVKIADFELELA
jgi:HlyD family secretion protein